jgi:hypothetical protein
MSLQYTLPPSLSISVYHGPDTGSVSRVDLHGDHPFSMIMEKNPCFDCYLMIKKFKIDYSSRIYPKDSKKSSNSPVRSEISPRNNTGNHGIQEWSSYFFEGIKMYKYVTNHITRW